MSDDREQPDEPSATTHEDSSPPPGTFTFKRTFTFGNPPPDDPSVTVVQGPVRKFEWKWGGPSARSQPSPKHPELEGEPATYYEALSGRRDPHREFFVTSRRLLNTVVTVTAIGLPVGVVAAAIISGADLQTIVLFGIAAAIVGLMLKSSFPRTPFN